MSNFVGSPLIQALYYYTKEYVKYTKSVLKI